jgi:hypothetical protein
MSPPSSYSRLSYRREPRSTGGHASDPLCCPPLCASRGRNPHAPLRTTPIAPVRLEIELCHPSAALAGQKLTDRLHNSHRTAHLIASIAGFSITQSDRTACVVCRSRQGVEKVSVGYRLGIGWVSVGYQLGISWVAVGCRLGMAWIPVRGGHDTLCGSTGRDWGKSSDGERQRIADTGGFCGWSGSGRFRICAPFDRNLGLSCHSFCVSSCFLWHFSFFRRRCDARASYMPNSCRIFCGTSGFRCWLRISRCTVIALPNNRF